MHVYASLQDAKNYAMDEGVPWGEGSTNDALALKVLESVSRRVDFFCRRSDFGSGFGPRIGTNKYDGSGQSGFHFRDDLLTTSTVTLRASTGSSDTSLPAVDTDYFLVNQKGTYAPGPYRKALFHGQGGITSFPSGMKTVEWAGTWGHQDITEPAVPELGGALDNDDTAVTLDANGTDEGRLISPGMTLLIDTEMVYVRAIASDTVITVVRGVNGSTAASHLDEAAIAYYVYDPRVILATLRVWGKRWVARNAGADGSDGGGQVGMLTPREGEETILRRELGDLRLIGNVAYG